MENQNYTKLDVKDSEGNIVGFSFVRREKIPHLESLFMVPEGQKEAGSFSLEEDLDMTSSDDDEDLQQSSRQLQQESGGSDSSAASTSRDQSSHELEEEEEEEDEYGKLLRLVREYDENRLARRLHNYSKLMKAFNAGWVRICKVGEGGAIKVSYKSPDGKSLHWMHSVLKYLRESDSKLSEENFSFEKKFLGFEREHETISISESYHGQVSDRQSQEDPPEQSKFVWLRGGRIAGLQCLVCNKTVGGKLPKKNLIRHVKGSHPSHQDSKHVCTKCGKSFTRKSTLKNHIEKDKCKGKIESNKCKEKNENNQCKVKMEKNKCKDIIEKNNKIEETNSKGSDSPNQNTKSADLKVTEEEPASPVPVSARVLIESPAVGGLRRVQVKLRSSRVMGKFLNNLLKSSGYQPTQVEWLCEGRVLTGNETAGFLHNRSVKFRIKN